MNLSKIVKSYKKYCRSGAERERRYFRIQRTFEDALKLAALAQKPDGKRFGHQRRIPKTVLLKSLSVLLKHSRPLKKSDTFEELHGKLSDLVGNIKGIGALYLYDTAFRIGAFLNLEPVYVYLHAGTSRGAKNLGLKQTYGLINLNILPPALKKLRAWEVEDILCIYKDELKRHVLSSKSRDKNTCGLQRLIKSDCI
jgi:hypothetical protein